jgi:anti-sigma regulatory factor (Ser/Thr protein kinase)
MRTSFELKTGSSLDELTRITDFVLGSVRGSSLADRERYHLVMAVDEACTNIIRYGGSCEIRVKCEVGDDMVVVEIRDDGVTFNPLEAPTPDLDLPLEERVVGGLGIYFIKTLTDEVKYERRDGKNILTMTFRHRQDYILRR